MNGPSPLRCFWTICRPPAAAWLAAASLFAWGAHVAAKRPKDFHEIVALAMLGQMLAASTGFRDRLVRGHFDPVLAGRRSRVAHGQLRVTHPLVADIARLGPSPALNAIDYKIGPLGARPGVG